MATKNPWFCHFSKKNHKSINFSSKTLKHLHITSEHSTEMNIYKFAGGSASYLKSGEIKNWNYKKIVKFKQIFKKKIKNFCEMDEIYKKC